MVAGLSSLSESTTGSDFDWGDGEVEPAGGGERGLAVVREAVGDDEGDRLAASCSWKETKSGTRKGEEGAPDIVGYGERSKAVQRVAQKIKGLRR